MQVFMYINIHVISNQTVYNYVHSFLNSENITEVKSNASYIFV